MRTALSQIKRLHDFHGMLSLSDDFPGGPLKPSKLDAGKHIASALYSDSGGHDRSRRQRLTTSALCTSDDPAHLF